MVCAMQRFASDMLQALAWSVQSGAKRFAFVTMHPVPPLSDANRCDLGYRVKSIG